MITHLNLCHHHKYQQLTCQSHRVDDHFVNPRTIPLQPYGMPLIMTWIVTMTNQTVFQQLGKINLSMVNSHNKVISGMCYSGHIII
mgnify:CR=1 FL=1